MFRYLTTAGAALPDLTGHTVIIPSLGVGNVGQLSVDMLIATMRLTKVATLWHPAIVPIAGPAAFDHDSDPTTSACELYTSHIQPISVLQLRSPLVPAAMDAFFGLLVEHLNGARVARLIVLTSSYAYEKHLIGSPTMEYLATEAYADQAKSVFENERMHCKRFGGEVIFGGGFARRLLDVAAAGDLAAVVLFKYASEGDNRPDAADMVAKLINGGIVDVALDVDSGMTRLVEPSSWALLFGNSAPADLY